MDWDIRSGYILNIEKIKKIMFFFNLGLFLFSSGHFFTLRLALTSVLKSQHLALAFFIKSLSRAE